MAHTIKLTPDELRTSSQAYAEGHQSIDDLLQKLTSTQEGKQKLYEGVKWDEATQSYKVRIYDNGVAHWITVSYIYEKGVRTSGLLPNGGRVGYHRGIAALYEAALGQYKGADFLSKGAPVNTGISILENKPSIYTFSNIFEANKYISLALSSGGSVDGTTAVGGTKQDYGKNKDGTKIELLKVPAVPSPSLPINPKNTVSFKSAHAYEIVDVKGDMIGLRNPWGDADDTGTSSVMDTQRVFYITKEDFARAFDSVAVEK